MRYLVLAWLILSSLSLQVQAQNSKEEIKEAKGLIKEADGFVYQSAFPIYSKALPLYLKAHSLWDTEADLKFKIGIAYLATTEKVKATRFLEEALELDPDLPNEARYFLARAYHLNHEFEKAIAEYTAYRKTLSPEDKKQMKIAKVYYHLIADGYNFDPYDKVYIDDLGRIISKRLDECEMGIKFLSKPVNVRIENIGDEVNTKDPEYAPVISADESVMYFTSRRSYDEVDEFTGQPFEDIFLTSSTSGKWTEPMKMGEPLDIKLHNSVVGLSADGQTMFIYRDVKGQGDIFMSKLDGNNWSSPEPMEAINSEYPERSVTLSANGKHLFFVSDRPKGKGGRDIWWCKMKNDGTWAPPTNLGSVVNTKYDEDGVFFHPDGKTLYFSSTGHNSMGGYDIFMTSINGGTWSKPKNLGSPINTADDDIYFVLSASGERGYYSSYKADGAGEKDIYVIHMKPKEEKPSVADAEVGTVSESSLTLLKGVITDASTGAFLNASIEVVDNATGEIYSTLVSNSATGKYIVTIPGGKNYGIAVRSEGYLFHSENIDIPLAKGYLEVKKDVPLNKNEKGAKLVLRNIFFDYDSDVLKHTSMTELGRVVKLLKEVPTMKIEISGHTDNKGDPPYNKTLSEKRAIAVVKHLSNAGIDASRMKAAGYGEEQPIAKNTNEDGTDNPDGRAQNRRVELEIL